MSKYYLEMSKRTQKNICDLHAEIMELCDEIERLEFKHAKLIKRQVIARTKKISKMTAKARLSGQSMENRLSEYYDAITGIGFKRTK